MSSTARILVTGSSGFIGKAVSAALVAEGFEVWSLARHALEGPTSIRADLLNFELLREALSRVPPVSTIIHLAALAHGQRSTEAKGCLAANLLMTENLLASLPDPRVHWIFTSSVAVYGEDSRSGAVSINDRLQPATDYGLSKQWCEERLLGSSLAHLDILRVAPVFDEFHLKDVRKRVFFPGTRLKLRLIPAPEYSLCQVQTLVRLTTALVRRGPAGRSCFHVADAEPYSQRVLLGHFPGPAVPVPEVLIRPLYWVFRCIPGRFGYGLRCLYWKLFRSNVYATQPAQMPEAA